MTTTRRSRCLARALPALLLAVPLVAAASPILFHEEKLTASDGGPGDLFGASVALSGDVAVAGAREDDDLGAEAGAAYVFRFDGTDWVEEQKLTASDGVAGDRLGPIAVSGDRVLVGAPNRDDTATDTGAAYVFRFDGSDWVEEQKLTPSDAAPGDFFGHRVAISGPVALVSSAWNDQGGTNAGAVYVFRFDGTDWVEEQKLTASDAAPSDFFGFAVSVSGDRLIATAHFDDDDGSLSGSAYVFRFDGNDWVEEQKLTASDGAAGDLFGYAVSLSGGVAIIGAELDSDNGSQSGSAYVFRHDGTGWVEEQKLLASDGDVDDVFGQAVAISGDTALVGAVWDDDSGSNSGSAYVFRFDGSDWVEEQKIVAFDAAATDNFSGDLALSGDAAIVGAAFDDDQGAQSGSAYVFRFDSDLDGYRDGEDNCPLTANPDQTDGDADGVGDPCDDCQCVANPDQSDADSDGAGDACDLGDTGPLNGLCVVGPNPIVPQEDVVCLPGIGQICF